MKYHKAFLVATVASALAFFPLLAPADDPPEKKHGEDVKKLCKEVEAEYKDKSHRDVERIMDLYQVFCDITPMATDAEKKLMARTLKKGFDIKPFPEEAGFLCTAAACLAELGKPGLDALLHAVNHKNLKVRIGMDQISNSQRRKVRETVIEALGFNKNPGALKTLYKLLNEKDAGSLRSACRALGHFNGLPLEQRKPVVEKVMKAYSRLEQEAEEGGDESEAYDRLLIVEVAFNDALQKLTYRNFQTVAEWKEWYKENKDKKKW